MPSHFHIDFNLVLHYYACYTLASVQLWMCNLSITGDGFLTNLQIRDTVYASCNHLKLHLTKVTFRVRWYHLMQNICSLWLMMNYETFYDISWNASKQLKHGSRVYYYEMPPIASFIFLGWNCLLTLMSKCFVSSTACGLQKPSTQIKISIFYNLMFVFWLTPYFGNRLPKYPGAVLACKKHQEDNKTVCWW